MKILQASQLKALDQCSIETDRTSLEALIESAASACFAWLQQHIARETTFVIFCGTGNNGRDGLALADLLLNNGKNVRVYSIHPLATNPDKHVERGHGDKAHGDKAHDDKAHGDRAFSKRPHCWLVSDSAELPVLLPEDTVIDALLGTGLSRPVSGIYKETVEHINKSKAFVVSIDMPTGLFADQLTDLENAVVQASVTLTFQLPRLAFLLPENEFAVGDWTILPIDISQKCIDAAQTKNIFLTEEIACSIVKPRRKFSHKGLYGHALLIAGSKGKMGAALLAGRACLHSGAGLLTLHVPGCGFDLVQAALPEAMASQDAHEEIFTNTFKNLNDKTIGTGPGLGTDVKSQGALKLLIQAAGGPVVFDADALNILAENKTWLHFIPKNSILTPHPKEFERLAGKTFNSFERQQVAIDFAVKYQVYLVLKGAHTLIACPDGMSYFNSTGNAGMAKGGTGDVLTGILLGLLSQKYTPLETCLLGVYLHGKAADIAVASTGIQSLMANDIIEHIGAAYKMPASPFP